MDLPIDELPPPQAVEQDQAVAGPARPPLQQGHADGHAQLGGKGAKRLRKGSIGGDGLGSPLRDGPAVNAVSITPHFREQGDVRPQLPGPPAVFHALLQIALDRVPGGDLQQREVQNAHGRSLLSVLSCPVRRGYTRSNASTISPQYMVCQSPLYHFSFTSSGMRAGSMGTAIRLRHTSTRSACSK